MSTLPRGVRRPAGRMRLVALIAIGIAAIAVVFVATRSSGTYEVTAVFDDVRGLIQGGEVRAGGVKVGTVEEIGFTDDRLPEVTMRIDSDYELRQGAFANIRLASNVGVINRFVDLTQGEGPPLGDGATLGPSHTDQPVDLDLAVSTLDPKTRREISSLIANLDRATRGRGDDLAATLRHSADSLGETANLLAEVTADGQALRTLVEQGRTVVGALASDPNDLAATADRLASVLATAAGRQNELRRSVDAIGPGLVAAHRTLDRFAASTGDLRDLVEVARPAVAQLRPIADALRPVVEAIRPLFAEARKLAAPLRSELDALRPVIAAALPITKQLPGVLGGLTPLLDQLRAHAPEVVSFFTLFGDATSDYDVNGNMIRTTAIPIQGNRHPNQIPATSNAPGSVERPYDRYPGAAEGEPWERYWDSFIGGAKPTQAYLDATGQAGR
jgi:phospholipid/cholesterol/gamma-HCH transport system substrate-binding protein